MQRASIGEQEIYILLGCTVLKKWSENRIITWSCFTTLEHTAEEI
jgi:hypothetical protein